MKANDLLNLIGDADDSMIAEAKIQQKRKKNNWVKWGAMAACLCLVAIGSIVAVSNQNPPNSDDYPYNDGDVLDFVGMPLNDLNTAFGTIAFNEITDIEAYRQFNTNYGYENKPYYSTRTSAYDYLTWYPVNDEKDFINVSVFEKNGSIENCLNYDEFLIFKDKAPVSANLIMRILDKGYATQANAYYNSSIDSSGVSFNPESNCIATVIVGKDLSSIDSRFESILPILQSALGTEHSSYIGGQEISVYYFYQNRLYRNSKTEEAFQYYVYFERDGLQYFYQFSSNWSLIGQNVSAIHNPPSTLHYVKTQDECRELFANCLFTLLEKPAE